MKKKLFYISLLLIVITLFTACLAGPNTAADIPSSEGELAGFIMGLWHGVIAPVSFFISLFTENIHMYEIHNNGGWYDFGFVIGAGIIFGGSSKASCRKRK